MPDVLALLLFDLAKTFQHRFAVQVQVLLQNLYWRLIVLLPLQSLDSRKLTLEGQVLLVYVFELKSQEFHSL